MSYTPEISKIHWFAFRAIAVYLIAIAIYRIVVPAYGLPALNFTYKMIFLDIGLVAMFLVGRLVLSDLTYDIDRKEQFVWYFRIGLAGGIIILCLRFAKRQCVLVRAFDVSVSRVI